MFGHVVYTDCAWWSAETPTMSAWPKETLPVPDIPQRYSDCKCLLKQKLLPSPPTSTERYLPFPRDTLTVPSHSFTRSLCVSLLHLQSFWQCLPRSTETQSVLSAPTESVTNPTHSSSYYFCLYPPAIFSNEFTWVHFPTYKQINYLNHSDPDQNKAVNEEEWTNAVSTLQSAARASLIYIQQPQTQPTWKLKTPCACDIFVEWDPSPNEHFYSHLCTVIEDMFCLDPTHGYKLFIASLYTSTGFHIYFSLNPRIMFYDQFVCIFQREIFQLHSGGIFFNPATS